MSNTVDQILTDLETFEAGAKAWGDHLTDAQAIRLRNKVKALLLDLNRAMKNEKVESI